MAPEKKKTILYLKSGLVCKLSLLEYIHSYIHTNIQPYISSISHEYYHLGVSCLRFLSIQGGGRRKKLSFPLTKQPWELLKNAIPRVTSREQVLRTYETYITCKC